MVHALREIWGVLKAGGTLIDLRPIGDQWPIEVISRAGRSEAGRATDLEAGMDDDAAANEAMTHGERLGLFRREAEESFDFYYSWDSPREMQEYVEEDWGDTIAIGADVWKRVRSGWALAEADARVGMRVKMLITRLLKIVPASIYSAGIESRD
jgi:hypothetical protein